MTDPKVEMVVVNGVRYRPEDAPKSTRETDAQPKAERPTRNKARRPAANKAEES